MSTASQPKSEFIQILVSRGFLQDATDFEGLDEAPGDDAACLEDTGPLAHPPEPERDAAAYPFWP